MSTVFKKKVQERWKVNFAVPSSFKERLENINEFLGEHSPEQEFKFHDFLEEAFDKHLKRAEKEIESIKKSSVNVSLVD